MKCNFILQVLNSGMTLEDLLKNKDILMVHFKRCADCQHSHDLESVVKEIMLVKKDDLCAK